MLQSVMAIIGRMLERMEVVAWKFKYASIRSKYQLEKSLKFNGPHVSFYGDGKIIIGKNTYIGGFSTIQTYDGCQVSIGSNCSISHNVRIYTCNKNSLSVISGQKITNSSGDVFIGNNTWVGANVFICEGVKIGEHCVIGANSVVTSDVPDRSVAAGAPARVIKSADEK